MPKNMRLLRLAPYSPELNPVENIWGGLREKFFGNVVFDKPRLHCRRRNGMGALEGRLILGLKHLEDPPEITKSLSSWYWIIIAFPLLIVPESHGYGRAFRSAHLLTQARSIVGAA